MEWDSCCCCPAAKSRTWSAVQPSKLTQLAIQSLTFGSGKKVKRNLAWISHWKCSQPIYRLLSNGKGCNSSCCTMLRNTAALSVHAQSDVSKKGFGEILSCTSYIVFVLVWLWNQLRVKVLNNIRDALLKVQSVSCTTLISAVVAGCCCAQEPAACWKACS